MGEQGLVQVIESTSAELLFERRYVPELRRFSEVERVLRYLEQECARQGFASAPLSTAEGPAPDTMDHAQLEAAISTVHTQLGAILSNNTILCTQQFELFELQKVMDYCGKYLTSDTERQVAEANAHDARAASKGGISELHEPLLAEERVSVNTPGQLGFVAGVIRRDKTGAFEKLIWRACRGNVLLRTVPRFL
jgi:V-type H+-transporting ATPase subunit a